MVTGNGAYNGYRISRSGCVETARYPRPTGVLRHLCSVGHLVPGHSDRSAGGAPALRRRNPVLCGGRVALRLHAIPRAPQSNGIAMAQPGPHWIAHVRGRVWSSILGGEICAVRHRIGARGHAAAHHHGSRNMGLSEAPLPLAASGRYIAWVLWSRHTAVPQWSTALSA